MARCLALAALAVAVLSAAAATNARAAEKFPCEAFVRLGDGTWQALTTTLIPDRNFRVQEGSLWRPGAAVMGMDVAATLEKECPNAAVVSPEGVVTTPNGVPLSPAQPGAALPPLGTAQTPQAPQAPIVPLARFADANGSIDVRRLTCGQLDDASPVDADTLLSWYSGWYSGAAKGRGVNLARVRYAVRSVIDYCKSNREKNLAQVMELMLK